MLISNRTIKPHSSQASSIFDPRERSTLRLSALN